MKINKLYVASAAFLCAAVFSAGCSRSKPIGLGLLGYNYTERKIESYSVTDPSGGSAWGGDVALSSPGSGGSKTTCCIMLNPDSNKAVILDVDWTFSEVKSTSGYVVEAALAKHGSVTIRPPYPKDPGDLEIHFYPDGHLEGEVTEYATEPRIVHPKGSPGTE